MVMKEAGLHVLPELIHQVSGNSAEKGDEAVDYFVNLRQRPTALICYNDLMAIGVLKGLYRTDFRVPEDMSVTGFDNISYSDFTQPPLTTIDQPKRFLGAEAARMMFTQLGTNMNSSLTEPCIKRLKGMLIIRQSTAAPRKE